MGKFWDFREIPYISRKRSYTMTKKVSIPFERTAFFYTGGSDYIMGILVQMFVVKGLFTHNLTSDWDIIVKVSVKLRFVNSSYDFNGDVTIWRYVGIETDADCHVLCPINVLDFWLIRFYIYLLLFYMIAMSVVTVATRGCLQYCCHRNRIWLATVLLN